MRDKPIPPSRSSAITISAPVTDSMLELQMGISKCMFDTTRVLKSCISLLERISEYFSGKVTSEKVTAKSTGNPLLFKYAFTVVVLWG